MITVPGRGAHRPTSAIVGPSSRTMRLNGGLPVSTATRPTGMPETKMRRELAAAERRWPQAAAATAGAGRSDRSGRSSRSDRSMRRSAAGRCRRSGRVAGSPRIVLRARASSRSSSATSSWLDATRPSRMMTMNVWKMWPYLLVDVVLEVERRIGGERGSEIGGHQHREPARGLRGHRSGDAIARPQEQRGLRRPASTPERR